MSIKSIIIDKETKAQRISYNRIQLDLLANTKPNSDLCLYINTQLLQNIISDEDWNIKETIVISDMKSKNITVKLENVIQLTSNYISFELQVINEKKEAMKDMRENWLNLSNTKYEIFRDNYDVVMVAVKQNWLALEFASNNLQNDNNIVMEAVKNNWKALKFASYEIQKNRNIVIEAIKNDLYALEYTQINNDYDIGMMRVKRDWTNLAYLSKDLQNNRNIVIEAVKQDWIALHWASNKMKDDRDIVMTALKKTDWYWYSINALTPLKNASDRLKNDFDIFNITIENHQRIVLPTKNDFHKFIEYIYNYKCPFKDFIHCVDNYELWPHNDEKKFNDNKFLVLLCLSREKYERTFREVRNSYYKDILSKVSVRLKKDKDVLKATEKRKL